jgi:NADH-quinone oxidoreductase subunit J
MPENILFYLFGGIALGSAITVITTKNPVHSVLFLILSFISSAGLLFLLEIEFISLIFIVVYVGAIAVLFLFVVMMLDIKITDSNPFFFKYFPIGSFLGFAFLVELLLTVTEILKSNPETWDNSYHWASGVDGALTMIKQFIADCGTSPRLTQLEFHFSNWSLWSGGNDNISADIIANTKSDMFWLQTVDYATNIDVVGQVLYTYYFLYFLISGILLLVAMIGAIVLTLTFTKKSRVQILPRQVSRQFANAIFSVKS